MFRKHDHTHGFWYNSIANFFDILGKYLFFRMLFKKRK